MEKYAGERTSIIYGGTGLYYEEVEKMNVGSMEIVGTINVENIKMGLDQMKSSIEGAKTQAKSLFGDMERLGSSVSGLGKKMAAAGVGILGTFTALASVGPQTSVAMERLKYESFMLGMNLDSVLGPAFNNAVDYAGKLNDYLGGDGKGLVEAFGATISGVGDGLVVFANLANDAFTSISAVAKDWSASLSIDFSVETLGDIAKALTPAIIAGLITKKFSSTLKLGKAAGPLGLAAAGVTMYVTSQPEEGEQKTTGERILSGLGGLLTGESIRGLLSKSLKLAKFSPWGRAISAGFLVKEVSEYGRDKYQEKYGELPRETVGGVFEDILDEMKGLREDIEGKLIMR